MTENQNRFSGQTFERSPIPAKAGVGLRSVHYQEILDTKPDIAWVETHPENYFGGGAHLAYLEKIRALYPLSFHAVGLSLGSYDGVNDQHLMRFKKLVDRFQPDFVSDHASWSLSGNAHLNDLLPLPLTDETVDVVCRNIDKVQNALRRPIFVENPSSYLAFKDDAMPEWEFMKAIAQKAGCKLLFDVNNIYVSAENHGFDAMDYLTAIPAEFVGEIHLAGHTRKEFDNGQHILIDTHGNPVPDPVWELYQFAIGKFGAVPTLIEWDKDIPELSVLLDEADKAQKILDEKGARHAA